MTVLLQEASRWDVIERLDAWTGDPTPSDIKALVTHALFTDSRFHNLGVGFERINKDVKELGSAYVKAKRTASEVDVEVLTNKNTSELGRFAVSTQWRDMGSFKTPTLRNIAKTAPYMHDGSLESLLDVVKFYNNGGRVNESDPTFDF